MVALLVWVWGVQRPLPGALVARWSALLATVVSVSVLWAGGWLAGRLVERLMAWPEVPAWSRLGYRAGWGVVLWSWASLALAVVGESSAAVVRFLGLVAAAIVLLGFWRERRALWTDLRSAWQGFPPEGWLAALLIGLSALLPPTSFDALMYHLALPERLLQTGRLEPLPIAHFWNPGLVEHTVLWPLAFGLDSSARLTHALWATLAALWVFHWTRERWGRRPARAALWLVLSMPSFPLLASWAYTDFALTFYAVASVYAFARYREQGHPGWLRLAGTGAGLALSIKYTAGALFLALLMLSLAAGPRTARRHRAGTITFGAVAMAWPWYLRNAVYMGNPVYPFFFGGRGWDAFLEEWHGQGGTGLGLRFLAWLRFPFEAVAGIGDLSYVDGRMGAWWLILLPIVLMWLPRLQRRRRPDVEAMLGFGLVGLGFWLVGVAWSALLRQGRLLFPVLVVVAPLWGYAVHGVRAVQPLSGGFRLRGVVRALLALSVALTLVEHVLGFVEQQGPAYLAGLLSREAFDRANIPLYEDYRSLLARAPEDARVLALFEPRSYRAPREVFPDTILALWPHALARYGSPQAAVRVWREQGYTHLVIAFYAARFLHEGNPQRYTREHWQALQDLSQRLPLVACSPERAYCLYRLEVPTEGSERVSPREGGAP